MSGGVIGKEGDGDEYPSLVDFGVDGENMMGILGEVHLFFCSILT